MSFKPPDNAEDFRFDLFEDWASKMIGEHEDDLWLWWDCWCAGFQAAFDGADGGDVEPR